MIPRLAIPQGDLGGIGPEVALNVLSRADVRERCRPLMLGHVDALRSIAADCGVDVELQSVDGPDAGFAVEASGAVPVWELESPMPTAEPGKPHHSFGFASVEAVLRGGNMCLEGRADAVVTPPIHKESMHMAGYNFEGQTQIFGELSGSRRYGMLACNGNLRVLVATRHMALKKAISDFEVNQVAKQVRIAHEAARDVLGIDEPRIVLAGLNPHAGEGGAFGNEESKVLKPGIDYANSEYGYVTAGPAVPDMVFLEGSEGKWDIVIALYHDQAFIPLKLLGRKKAYTLFVGGKILRVSPMHGAAYDIARTAQADPEPFAYSLEQAIQLATQKAAQATS